MPAPLSRESPAEPAAEIHTCLIIRTQSPTEEGVMTQEEARIHAPDLVGGYWGNSEPLNIADLRGKAVLIDFWDFTCVNCIHTLPYVAEWHRRYARLGLAVVGVHAPEFSFAKELDGVKQAIASFHIEYPVVMDNGY